MLDTKIKGMIGKKKKLKLAAVRWTHQHFIERLVQKMQGLIYWVDLDAVGCGIITATSTGEALCTTAADRRP